MKYFFLPSILLLLSLNLFAQTVPTPTQTDAIIIDNGTPGKADPNDRIRYNVIIQNTGAAPATGVQLNAVPDPRTTLVPGSFRTSPVAANDAYTATGNVPINVSAGSGVKANDYDDHLAGATITAGTFATTQGGTIVLAADGGFTYTPLAGFNGADTYVYTLNDGNPVGGAIPTTDMATVTITVSNMIWFVDNTGGGSGGAGSLANPFKTLANFNGSAAPQAGHVVFVKNAGAQYGGGIVLKNNMYLFGTGHTGGSNLADAGVLPFTVAPNSAPLPAINGSRTILYNITGTGIGIALASGNTIRGVEVIRCNGAKILGSGFGTLTIGNTTSPDVALNGGQVALNLTNGAFAATSKLVSINCLDTSGILLNTVSGSLASGSTTVNANQSGKAMDIQNSSAALDFGPTTANHFGGGTVISIINSGAGSVTFGSLSIPNAGNGVGLIASTGGTINIGGTSNSITARTALDITNTSFGSGATFASITSTNSGAKGVNLDNVTGSLVINGGSITNSAGIAFDINAGSSTISYAGTISNANRAVEITGRTGGTVTFSGNITNTGTGINVASNTGGTLVFSGASKSLTTTTNTAVTLATNPGAIINFTGGGLVIFTTTGAGFSATGGGTVNVTGATNTITSVSNTALNVSSTTIGASNLNFRSISAGNNTAAADPGTGILLFTTGASGGLIITGTGTTNGSGGTIQNITNRGVDANTTISLSLSNMTFTNANTVDGGGPCNAADNSGCNAAIHLNAVTGANLNNVNINNTAEEGINVRNTTNFSLNGSNLVSCGIASSGSDTEESCLYAINMSGICDITNSSLTFPSERAAVIYNTSKTLALTVSGSTFGMNQTMTLGADGLEVNSYGASNTTLDVLNSTFVQPKTNGLQVITENTSVTSVDITGCTFDPGPGLAAAMDLVVNNTASMTFNVVNNPSIKGKGINIVNVFAFPNATYEGRINNNTVISNGGSGTGIRVFGQGNGNSKVEIKNNNVTGGDDYGIDVTSQLGTGRMDATITGNTVSVTNSGFYAIHVLAGNSGSVSTNKVCANVASNATTVPAGAIGNFQARSATVGHEILLQGVGASVAAIWAANANMPNPGITSQSGAGVFTFGATCLIPANPGP